MNICQFTPTGTNMSTMSANLSSYPWNVIMRKSEKIEQCLIKNYNSVLGGNKKGYWRRSSWGVLKGTAHSKNKNLYFTYSSHDQWYHSKIGYNFFERELKNINFHFCNFLKTPVLRKTVRLFPFNFFERRPTNTKFHFCCAQSLWIPMMIHHHFANVVESSLTMSEPCSMKEKTFKSQSERPLEISLVLRSSIHITFQFSGNTDQTIRKFDVNETRGYLGLL